MWIDWSIGLMDAIEQQHEPRDLRRLLRLMPWGRASAWERELACIELKLQRLEFANSIRPIGKPVFEDKMVQRAVAMLLEAIYEPDFSNSSYGFRPGRSPHLALRDLREHCMGEGIGWLIAKTGMFASAILVWVTGILSGLTDNVPLAAMLAKMLPADTAPDIYWSAIIGGNLGGNITPIGSAAVVVGVTLMKHEGIKITFTGFMKTATPFAIVQLIIGSIYLLVLRSVL